MALLYEYNTGLGWTSFTPTARIGGRNTRVILANSSTAVFSHTNSGLTLTINRANVVGGIVYLEEILEYFRFALSYDYPEIVTTYQGTLEPYTITMADYGASDDGSVPCGVFTLKFIGRDGGKKSWSIGKLTDRQETIENNTIAFTKQKMLQTNSISRIKITYTFTIPKDCFNIFSKSTFHKVNDENVFLEEVNTANGLNIVKLSLWK